MPDSYAVLSLGKLKKVRVRDAWPDEARNFTPWLATEGLEALSFELGVDLEIIKTEHAVGRYSLDILAAPAGIEDEQRDSNLVVIENQFGATDHDHLGKLMTYASGVGTGNEGAKTIVWVSEEFREEHQRALEWLNNVTQPGIRFYGVQLELYKIGDSLAAPTLNVLVKPNEIVRARRQDSQTGESERSLFYVDYWTAFKDYCVNQNAPFQLQTPKPTHYVLAALGRAGVHLSFVATRRDKWVSCELYLNGSDFRNLYAELENEKASLEARVPGLQWEQRDGYKSAKVFRRQDFRVGDRTSWPEQHEWLFAQGSAMFTAFSPLVR